jgi:hypothetical protein
VTARCSSGPMLLYFALMLVFTGCACLGIFTNAQVQCDMQLVEAGRAP